MSLEVFALWSEILGSLAVIVAIGFGAIQIRQFKMQRRDLAAVELVRSFQDREFTQSFRLIHSLPVGISGDDLRAKGVEVEDAALLLGMKYETMGVLVYNHVVPIEVVSELVGGVALSLWDRLHPWIRDIRSEQSQDLFLEWYEWLTERLREYGRDEQSPANIRFANWSPKR